ncbi:MAG: hypothetical protein JKY65_11975 [Planctomycetes bacterium]|nr:hypothetical protein [Planctomycetota bacterium]
MTDERLRTLERRWRESGALEDEAACLQERLRTGALSQARYELAVALGAPALGGEESPPLRFQEWISSLPFHQRRGRLERDWARVPLAMARAILPCVERLGGSSRYRAALRVTTSRLLRVRLSPRKEAAAGGLLRNPLLEGWANSPQERALTYFVEFAILCLAASPPSLPRFEDVARRALYPQGRWGVEPGVEEALEATIPAAGGRLWGLRLAVRDEVLPWALGYRDPLESDPHAFSCASS